VDRKEKFFVESVGTTYIPTGLQGIQEENVEVEVKLSLSTSVRHMGEYKYSPTYY
jgi:hypothetical protein